MGRPAPMAAAHGVFDQIDLARAGRFRRFRARAPLFHLGNAGRHADDVRGTHQGAAVVHLADKGRRSMALGDLKVRRFTPSFMGGWRGDVAVCVLPSISLASRPTASTLLPPRGSATDGDHRRAQTAQCLCLLNRPAYCPCPDSIAKSLRKKPNSGLKNISRAPAA
jgi:hypothetical protein